MFVNGTTSELNLSWHRKQVALTRRKLYMIKYNDRIDDSFSFFLVLTIFFLNIIRIDDFFIIFVIWVNHV